MAQQHPRRRKARRRGAAAKANADLMTHIASLGLKTVTTYRSWCHEHGLNGALNKTWQERRQERTVARQDEAEAEDHKALMAHIAELGLNTETAYRAWCGKHGLSDALNKSAQQRRKELDLAVRLQSDAVLAGMKAHKRRPRETIQRIYRGEIDAGELRGDSLQKIHEAFATLGKDRRARKALLELLLHAQQHADLFGVKPAISRLGPQDGNTFIQGIGAMAAHHRDWMRPVDAWRPDSHNSRRQFGALARHILARYHVPAFMDAAWFLGCNDVARQQQAWFKHIAAGQNIRKADIPVQLTKKMAHLFLQAPDDCTVEEALRWGQILGLGGEERLVRAVNGTRLGASFEREDFWRTVIHFLVNHPMLDMDQVGPIVDYIYNQKYVPQEIVGPGGNVTQGPPAQPNFAVKGRSMDKLVRQMEAWHRQLARDTRLPHRQWAPSGYDPFDHTEKSGSDGTVRWRIQELLSTKELAAEGRAMHHCVGSYSSNCQRGNTSIWSMQVTDAESERPYRVMTIAVNNRGRSISQARGKYNALPSGKTPNGKQRALERSYRGYLKDSKRILRLWREQEGLTMSSYT